MRKLVCLVADKNIKSVVSKLLEERKPSLGLPDFDKEIFVHNERDPGCYHNGPQYLQNLIKTEKDRGLLIFDQDWSGNPHETALETESAVRRHFNRLGIDNYAEVVVIEPEIEVWVWSNSPHVVRELGWDGNYTNLRSWLENKGLWHNNDPKPSDPKEAVEMVLREKQIPRSSALYSKLAGTVSLRNCQDASFNRFRSSLQKLLSG